MKNIKNLMDDLHLEDLRNESHPSIFDENEDYDMLILRMPIFLNELSAKSLGFVISKEDSYFYNRQINDFEKLNGRFEGPYKILDDLTDKMLKSFAKYQDEVADMEELLYVGKIKDDFMNTWLGLKLEILRIERILIKAANAIDEFVEFHKNTETFPINHYVDLYEHLERTVRSSALQLSKLDYLYSFYNAKSNDKMNRMIYLLTIISAIFLPLNLVVGFFGMNTSGLPFAEGNFGTYNAIVIMTSLVIITSSIVYFWRKRVEK
nr:CorA family divalent cation transporter [uncultured Sulfurimonas sp.]